MKTIKTGLILSACAIICVGALAFAQKRDYPVAPQYVPLPNEEFPIRATYAFIPELINDQEFQWVRDAGFNVISMSQNMANLDSTLVLASKYKLYVTANIWGREHPGNMKKILDRYAADPYIWGVAIWDEPNASQFEKFGKIMDEVSAYRPLQNGFINLLPEVSATQLGAPDYRTYVEEYIRTVNPPFLSYDCYPVKVNGNGVIYIDPNFFNTLEIISDMAEKSYRPFWGFILSCKTRLYPQPRQEYLKFQIYSNLAYGAQALSYFTYGAPDFGDGQEFSDSPIDANGRRSYVWNIVRDVNLELRSLQHVFLGASKVDVSFTGRELPKGTKPLKTLPPPFRMLESGEEGVLVSHLKNGTSEYLLIVNRDVINKQKIRLSRSGAAVRMLGFGREILENGPTVTLDAGGFALYRIKE